MDDEVIYMSVSFDFFRLSRAADFVHVLIDRREKTQKTVDFTPSLNQWYPCSCYTGCYGAFGVGCILGLR